MGAHQAPQFLGFTRQEHWSGLPFPSPMHESERWKWSHSVVSDSQRFHGLKPPGSPVHGIFQARILEWVAIAFSYKCLLSSVQSSFLIFVTPWTTAPQASLSITNSQSLLKPMSIKLVMPSNHLILCCPLLLLPPIPPSIRVFPMSQLFIWGGQSNGISASTTALLMNIQDWSTLGYTDWISLQSKGHSRVLSNTIDQKQQFFGTQLSSQSNSHIHTWPPEKP